MKKIGIITMHSNKNYGAVLQSYALQKKICDLGYEAKLIDYIPDSELYNTENFHRSLSKRASVDNIRFLLNVKNQLKRTHGFEAFAKKYYNLTKRYTQNDLPKENELNMDVYITGSDQTFNLLLMGEPQARYPYFLDFVHNGKKISYASSMGEKILELGEKDRAWIKKALKDYSHIAVREEKAADFIEGLGIERPKITIDPTMLLTCGEWEKIAEMPKNVKGKYILFYSVLSDKWVVEAVKKISKETGLPVVAPHMKNRYELSAGFKRADYASPEEFIALVKNAEFVCTSSFHGTVFSIINNKPFISFILGEGNRIKTLLKNTGLESNAVYCGDEIHIPQSNCNAANDLLEILRKNSVNLLKDFIEA